MEVRLITVRSADFSVNSSGTHGQATYQVPEITREVMQGGSVDAYLDLGGGRYWFPLPDGIQFSDLVVATRTYRYGTGTFSLQVLSLDPAAV